MAELKVAKAPERTTPPPSMTAAEESVELRVSHARQIASFLEGKAGWFLVATLLIVVVLSMPVLSVSPDEMNSEDPGGTVHQLREKFERYFPSQIYGTFILVEARNGDMLTKESLLELYQNSERLRQADEEGELTPPGLPVQPYLFHGVTEEGQEVPPLFTIADVVHAVMDRWSRLDSLEEASDEHVKTAVNWVLSGHRFEELKSSLAEEVSENQVEVLGRNITWWTSSALIFPVAADKAKLRGAGAEVDTGSDSITDSEEYFSRQVQSVLRGEQHSYRLRTIAIDSVLEPVDEVGNTIASVSVAVLMLLAVTWIVQRSLRARIGSWG